MSLFGGMLSCVILGGKGYRFVGLYEDRLGLDDTTRLEVWLVFILIVIAWEQLYFPILVLFGFPQKGASLIALLHKAKGLLPLPTKTKGKWELAKGVTSPVH